MPKNTKIFLSSCMYICISLLSCNAFSTKLIATLDVSENDQFVLATQLDLKTKFSRLTKLAPETQADELQAIVLKTLADPTKNNNAAVMEAMFSEIAKLAPLMQHNILESISETLIHVVITNNLGVIKAVFSGIAQLESIRQIDVLRHASQIIWIALGKKQRDNMIAVFKEIAQLAPQTQKCVLDNIRFMHNSNSLQDIKNYVRALFSGVAQFDSKMQEYFLNKVDIYDLIYCNEEWGEDEDEGEGEDDGEDEDEINEDCRFYSYCCELVDVLFEGINRLKPEVQERALNSLDTLSIRQGRHQEIIAIYRGINQLAPGVQKYALEKIDLEKILINAICEDDHVSYRGIFDSINQLQPTIRDYALKQINFDNVFMAAILYNREKNFTYITAKNEEARFTLITEADLQDKVDILFANNLNPLNLASLYKTLTLCTDNDRIKVIFAEIAKLPSSKQQLAAFEQIKINNIFMATVYCSNKNVFLKIIAEINRINNTTTKQGVLQQIDIYTALKFISEEVEKDLPRKWFIAVIKLIKEVSTTDENAVSKALRQIMTPDFLLRYMLHELDGIDKKIIQAFDGLYENKNALYYILPELVHALEIMPCDEYNANDKAAACVYIIKYGAGLDKNYQKRDLLPIIFDILSQSIDCIYIGPYYNGSIEKFNELVNQLTKAIFNSIEILSKSKLDQELDFIIKLHVKIVDTKLWFKMPEHVKIYINNLCALSNKKHELIESKQACKISYHLVQEKVSGSKRERLRLRQKMSEQISQLSQILW